MDRLRRSSTDKVLFGVCGGLANYFQIDPVLIRVGFVALTLAGGSGLLIYLVLAIIMPGDTDVLGGPSTPGSVAAHDTASRRTQGLAAVLIIIGVVFLLSNLGLFRWLSWGVLWPVVLIAIGVLIIAQRYRR